MYRCDCHLHTVFSHDGKATPEQMLWAAEAAELDHIIFTEHCDCCLTSPYPPESNLVWRNIFNRDTYPAAIEALRGRSKTVKIGIGVELGEFLQDRDLAAYALDYSWDFVLGSLHNVNKRLDFMCYEYTDPEFTFQLFCEYFAELLQMVEQGGFDVLSHLTYVLRNVYRKGQTYDLSRHDEQIRAVLKRAAEKGIGIEVNTSGLRDVCAVVFPSLKYLRWYRELGGEIITVGSDAHRAEDLGKGIDDAIELVRSAGFAGITVFEQRKPILKEF